MMGKVIKCASQHLATVKKDEQEKPTYEKSPSNLSHFELGICVLFCICTSIHLHIKMNEEKKMGLTE